MRAVAHQDHSPGELGDVGLVGDQHHGDPALAERLEDGQHFEAGVRIEIAGGLVAQDELRRADQRPGDGHALLLAARELVRGVVLAIGEAHLGQGLAGPAAALGRRDRRIEQRELDVLHRAGAGEEVEALEDEADGSVANPGELVAREPRHVAPGEPVAGPRSAGPGSR